MTAQGGIPVGSSRMPALSPLSAPKEGSSANDSHGQESFDVRIREGDRRITKAEAAASVSASPPESEPASTTWPDSAPPPGRQLERLHYEPERDRPPDRAARALALCRPRGPPAPHPSHRRGPWRLTGLRLRPRGHRPANPLSGPLPLPRALDAPAELPAPRPQRERPLRPAPRGRAHRHPRTRHLRRRAPMLAVLLRPGRGHGHPQARRLRRSLPRRLRGPLLHRGGPRHRGRPPDPGARPKTYSTYWRSGKEQETDRIFPLACWVTDTDERGTSSPAPSSDCGAGADRSSRVTTGTTSSTTSQLTRGCPDCPDRPTRTARSAKGGEPMNNITTTTSQRAGDDSSRRAIGGRRPARPIPRRRRRAGRPGSTIPRKQVLVGDATESSRPASRRSVDCVITSPPYWILRDYQARARSASKRASRPGSPPCVRSSPRSPGCSSPAVASGSTSGTPSADAQGRRAGKGMVRAPERLLLALAEDGWIVRSKVIWSKTNTMPNSVADRLTSPTSRSTSWCAPPGTTSTSTRSENRGRPPPKLLDHALPADDGTEARRRLR